MKIEKEDIPLIMEGPGTKMRRMSGFGEMDAVFHEFPHSRYPASIRGRYFAIRA